MVSNSQTMDTSILITNMAPSLANILAMAYPLVLKMGVVYPKVGMVSNFAHFANINLLATDSAHWRLCYDG